jgi:hypothetical protein
MLTIKHNIKKFSGPGENVIFQKNAAFMRGRGWLR